MKKFEAPEVNIEKLDVADVITASCVDCDTQTSCPNEGDEF